MKTWTSGCSVGRLVDGSGGAKEQKGKVGKNPEGLAFRGRGVGEHANGGGRGFFDCADGRGVVVSEDEGLSRDAIRALLQAFLHFEQGV